MMASIALGTPSDIATDQAKALGQLLQHPPSQNRHPDAQWFPDAGLGLFIHWGIAAVRGEGDLSWTMLKNKKWHDGTITPNAYYQLIDQWNPNKLDFDKTLKAAKEAGFRYAVFVTKHHDGFTLWPSAYGEIGTKHSFNSRDFVKEYVDACHKHGLKVGFYYSPPDWYFDREYRKWQIKGEWLDMDHQPAERLTAPAEHVKKRIELARGQLTELLTNYGKIDLIWFDGGDGELSNAEVRELQPGIVMNRRNGEAGDYGDTEGKLPKKRFNTWFETCMPAWPLRMWSYHHNYPHANAAYVLTQLSCLRGWGGNLLANVGPLADGSLPEEAYLCWSEMAQWMKHSGEAVIATYPGSWPEKCNLPVTRSPNKAYIHFLPKLPVEIEGFPEEMKTLTKTKQVIPALPDYTNTAVLKDVSRPKNAILLRTGETIPFQWDSGTLTVTLSDNQRSGLVDIVKLEWAPTSTIRPL